jgi:hypothetical protein
MLKDTLNMVSARMVALSVLMLIGGCTTGASSTDHTIVIHHNPWKQRPGNAGLPPPQPSPTAKDQRFNELRGQFAAIVPEGAMGDAEDWVVFDGDGNFKCGHDFHPLAVDLSAPPGRGYLQGFYMFDGAIVHLAFGQGSFKKARVSTSELEPGINRFSFNNKTYSAAKDGPGRFWTEEGR